MSRWVRVAVWVAACFAPLAGSVRAGSVVLTAIQDNTLYETATNTQSNGAGVYLFSGMTLNGQRRRAVLQFDVAGAIPAGATIDSASLRMRVSRVPSGSGSSQTFSLRRVQASWGEGTSNAGSPGGTGTPAATSDATWVHRFYPATFWATAGGDFGATTSGSASVGGVGSTPTWGSTSGMVTDVQAWLDVPSTNFGWIVIGNEAVFATARRFDSSEATTPANRPTLTIQYTPGAGPTAGAVPDGDTVPGDPLRLEKGAGEALDLSWGASCAPTAVDYAVYEGLLGAFTTHVPLTCSTVGATGAGILPAAGNRYYLVVPTDGSVDGSYGRDSNGTERPASTAACRPQSLGAAACP